ncbi:MAG: SCO family protein [Nitrospirae bacterium]|nr:SCO family protein [Nitrospirota bacterium]
MRTHSALGLLTALLLAQACQKKADLPDFGEVPAFSLTERSGKSFEAALLRGHVWIVDFVFTRCTGPCPRLTGLMRTLQEEMPKEIHLLSITVDPEFDTPEVLREYAERAGAHPNRWFFLTGRKEMVASVVTQGFRLAMVEGESGDSIVHSTKLALVGPDGRLRGYFDSEDPEEVERLKKSAKALL